MEELPQTPQRVAKRSTGGVKRGQRRPLAGVESSIGKVMSPATRKVKDVGDKTHGD